MRKGFSKYSFQDDEDREKICRMVEQGCTDLEISKRTYWPIEKVRETRCEYFPTAGLAKYYLKSQALTLARRIVAEANVEEALDVLSRPNIGVLEPALKNAPGPTKFAVMTSINPQDLGGVKVAVGITGQLDQSVPVPPVQARPIPALPPTPVPVPVPPPAAGPVPAESDSAPCPSAPASDIASRPTRAAAKSGSPSAATRSSRRKSSKRLGKTQI